MQRYWNTRIVQVIKTVLRLENVKPYNQDATRKQLNKALVGIGVKPSEYSKHSFRIVEILDMWK